MSLTKDERQKLSFTGNTNLRMTIERTMYQDCLSPPDNAEICNKFIAVERRKMITIVLVK